METAEDRALEYARQLARLRAENEELRYLATVMAQELAKWGWGDMHYGPQPQDRNVVAVLEEYRRVLHIDVLTCTAVTIRKQRGVTSRDIRIPLDRYVDTMYRHPAFVGRAPAAGQRRRRRVITEEFLKEVVDAYLAGGRSVDAVRADHRFAASQSQVFRWLQRAREAGLLDEEG